MPVHRLGRAGDLRHRVCIVRDRLDNPLVDRAWIDDDEEAEADKCGDERGEDGAGERLREDLAHGVAFAE